jgi:hypothetical protein
MVGAIAQASGCRSEGRLMRFSVTNCRRASRSVRAAITSEVDRLGLVRTVRSDGPVEDRNA